MRGATAFGLAFALGIATPAWAQERPLPRAGLPVGTVLLEQGLAADGRRVLVQEAASGGACWAVRAFDGGGTTWRAGARASGGTPGGGGCSPVVAAASADGALAAVFAYRDDQASLLAVGPDAIEPAGTASITGKKSFTIPAPGGVAVAASGALLLGATNYECKIGVPYDRCGTAILFRRDGAAWANSRAFPFPETGPFNLVYGSTVALSRDAGVIATGGASHVGHQGEVYLFERRADGFVEVGVLVPDTHKESPFGGALALAGDGRLIAVGGEQAVYVFSRDLQGWALVAKIEAPEPTAGYFGGAIALSGDARRLLVGAPRSGCGTLPRCGAAYLYERGPDAGVWRLLQRIDPEPPQPVVDFGWRVALDGTGRTAAIQGDRTWIVTLP